VVQAPARRADAVLKVSANNTEAKP
jgi:hypothetical protein